MKQIWKKDFFRFFSSLTGLTVAVVFYVIIGMFLWLMEGDFNIFYSGFADLKPFFTLIPWVLIFFVPAITMGMFSEEYKLGTIEILLTKPITTRQLVLGKFLAALSILTVILIPSVFYMYVIKSLAVPGMHPDYGVIFTSYLGVFLLMMLFVSVGIWVSSLTTGQMPAFLGTLFLLFLLYFGLHGLGDFNLSGKWDYYLKEISWVNVYEHFASGLIYLKDVLYWLLLTAFFLVLTIVTVEKRRG